MDPYTFGGKYRLEEEISIDGCGVHTTSGKEVTIKLEPAIAKSSPLKQESKIYKTLMNGPGVPASGDLFRMYNRHFSFKTVLMLADQLHIHSRDFVYCDIKPANFTASSDCVVNVIDFGLAKKFRDPRTSFHIPYHQDDHHGVGTCLFAAISTHLGIECSRRDDLEGLAYILIYFLRGTFPWRKIKDSSVSDTWDLIRDKKLETESVLTIGLSSEFDIVYKYVRALEFEDLRDYEGPRSLFRGLAEKHGFEYDGVFDWCATGHVEGRQPAR
ncbi:kinase-like protein [Epithele typhae]|uniref:kinase-like protein n=1 Tax=Epithele typhae TaxID=378194 RepID=UPI0020082842|nr:kinase-like protein [Epithele typhae]KAH9939742.1 kinase-like protein [Epithele typhae]